MSNCQTNMRYPIENQPTATSHTLNMYNLALPNPPLPNDPHPYQSNSNSGAIYFPTDYIYNNLPTPPHNPVYQQPTINTNNDHWQNFPATANRASGANGNVDNPFVNSAPLPGANHPSEQITEFSWNIFKVS